VVIADEIDDAPSAIALLNVLERKSRYFRPSQPTPE
jgi:hypothetical protein